MKREIIWVSSLSEPTELMQFAFYLLEAGSESCEAFANTTLQPV